MASTDISSFSVSTSVFASLSSNQKKLQHPSQKLKPPKTELRVEEEVEEESEEEWMLTDEQIKLLANDPAITEARLQVENAHFHLYAIEVFVRYVKLHSPQVKDVNLHCKLLHVPCFEIRPTLNTVGCCSTHPYLSEAEIDTEETEKDTTQAERNDGADQESEETVPEESSKGGGDEPLKPSLKKAQKKKADVIIPFQNGKTVLLTMRPLEMVHRGQREPIYVQLLGPDNLRSRGSVTLYHNMEAAIRAYKGRMGPYTSVHHYCVPTLGDFSASVYMIIKLIAYRTEYVERVKFDDNPNEAMSSGFPAEDRFPIKKYSTDIDQKVSILSGPEVITFADVVNTVKEKKSTKRSKEFIENRRCHIDDITYSKEERVTKRLPKKTYADFRTEIDRRLMVNTVEISTSKNKGELVWENLKRKDESLIPEPEEEPFEETEYTKFSSSDVYTWDPTFVKFIEEINEEETGIDEREIEDETETENEIQQLSEETYGGDNAEVGRDNCNRDKYVFNQWASRYYKKDIIPESDSGEDFEKRQSHKKKKEMYDKLLAEMGIIQMDEMSKMKKYGVLKRRRDIIGERSPGILTSKTEEETGSTSQYKTSSNTEESTSGLETETEESCDKLVTTETDETDITK